MLHPAATQDTPGPFTPHRLAEDLAALGLGAGDLVIAHVSIRSIGWTVGGGVGLLSAIRQVIGDTGTLMVPTFTTYLNDPRTWVNRPVPEDWWPEIRTTLPPFDPDLHAAQPGLGRFPELVRPLPGARRSRHPLYSFAAAGARADEVTRRHDLGYALGRNGPLSTLARGGKVLLLGAGWDRCSLLHLCEHRTPYPGRRQHVVPVPVGTCGAVTRWSDTTQLVMYEGDFAAIGEHAERAGIARRGTVGAASAVVCPAAALITCGDAWLAAHRDLRAAVLPAYFRDVGPAPTGEL